MAKVAIEMSETAGATESISVSVAGGSTMKNRSMITCNLDPPLRIDNLGGLPTHITLGKDKENRIVSIVHNYDEALTAKLAIKARQDTNLILDYVYSATGQKITVSSTTEFTTGNGGSPVGRGTATLGINATIIITEGTLDLSSISPLLSTHEKSDDFKLVLLREFAAFREGKDAQSKLLHAYKIVECLEDEYKIGYSDPDYQKIRAFRHFTHHVKLDNDNAIKILTDNGIPNPVSFNPQDVAQVNAVNNIIPQVEAYLREVLKQNGLPIQVKLLDEPNPD